MKLSIEIFPEQGMLRGCAHYDKSEMPVPYFLLNRDFQVEKIICDGKEVPVHKESTKIADWNHYCVQKVLIDKADSLNMEYTGRLSGKTFARTSSYSGYQRHYEKGRYIHEPALW